MEVHLHPGTSTAGAVRAVVSGEFQVLNTGCLHRVASTFLKKLTCHIVAEHHPYVIHAVSKWFRRMNTEPSER